MFKIPSFLSVYLLILGLSNAQAAVTTYTSQTDFLNNLSSSNVTTYNFDNLPSGSIIPSGTTVDGATFTYDIFPGVSIMVDDWFDTTSPNNYLGTDDGTFAFLGGDSFTISFDQSIRAIGMYVISSDLIFDNDFTIATNMGQSVSSLSLVDVSLADGKAYYLGLIEDDFNHAFTSITLSSFSDYYLFNVDDITVSAVPEPSTLLLFSIGLIGVLSLSRRKAQQSLMAQPT